MGNKPQQILLKYNKLLLTVVCGREILIGPASFIPSLVMEKQKKVLIVKKAIYISVLVNIPIHIFLFG